MVDLPSGVGVSPRRLLGAVIADELSPVDCEGRGAAATPPMSMGVLSLLEQKLPDGWDFLFAARPPAPETAPDT